MTRVVSTKDYEHGTHAKYVLNLCRCPECREAARIYNAQQRARLEPAFVAAEPARDHIRMLAAAGIGLKTVAKRSGVSHGALSKLVFGERGRTPSKRIRKETLDRIVAVMPSQVADGAKIPAGPTWALVDEMIAAGVPKSKIATALGQQGPGLQLSRNTVSARNARAVADIHARWRTGDLVLTRDHRHTGPVTITPPTTPTAPRPSADISDLILELAEIVEERNARTWRAHAACAGRPTYLWFPACGDHHTLDAGKRICDACLVRDQCRAENLDKRDGMYGGLSAKQRRALRSEHHNDAARPRRVEFAPLERFIAASYAPTGDTDFASRGRDRSVSDTRIADLTGTNRHTVLRWRSGGTIPADSAAACARALGVPTAAIWPELRTETAA